MTCYLVYCLNRNHTKNCFASFDFIEADKKYRQFISLGDFFYADIFEVNFIAGTLRNIIHEFKM